MEHMRPVLYTDIKHLSCSERNNTMANKKEKEFLTYNRQMRRLRDVKKIDCNGTFHKRMLVRSGYFNLVNGYKDPFTNGKNSKGEHIYLPNTGLDQFYAVKHFDDDLRSFLLRYITQVEEEVRTLVGYKFDQCNNNGEILWYDTDAYDPSKSLQSRMKAISEAYSELSRSKLDYVRFYMNNHQHIPTWIMFKVVNFSTFIEVLENSKADVRHSVCKLYGMEDPNGKPNVKLLIGSLHWMRTIRNSCAHNERVYCIVRDNNNGKAGNGRILEGYFRSLRNAYKNDLKQQLIDLFVYLKYYLPASEFQSVISEFKSMLFDLKANISPTAFDYIRAHMGIKDITDLDALVSLPKDDIEYNKFDKM